MNLESFLKSVERPAYRMAHIACRNQDDALDLVQDAMCRFVDKYAGRPCDEWKPLFYKIVHHAILDLSRRQMVRERVLGWFGRNADDETEPAIENIADEYSPNPEQTSRLSGAYDALQDALRKLPLRQQQAFLLRGWEEFSVEDTAKVMGCSEGSVKTHYFRAVQTLREQLGEHWP